VRYYRQAPKRRLISAAGGDLRFCLSWLRLAWAPLVNWGVNVAEFVILAASPKMHNTIRGQIEICAASAESIVLICDQNKRFDEFGSQSSMILTGYNRGFSIATAKCPFEWLARSRNGPVFEQKGT
jgi:hypothetical protein